jgi:aminoglycoside 3-N-acetyltransferase
MRDRQGLGDLAAGLRALGLRPGQDLLVHSSLRSVGPVAGGAATLLRAIQQVAGPDATVVVPAQTAQNSASSPAFRAATSQLDPAQLERYLAGMPAFDPRTTPSQGMGAFAEYVRTRPGAARSGHPQTSFAAVGARAGDCVRVHDLDCHCGPRSPLGWLYDNAADVLLIGARYSSFTGFHLAEYLLPGQRPTRAYHCVSPGAGGDRRFAELWDIDLDESDFAALGARMDSMPFVRRGHVGAADCRLVPIRLAVDFALADHDFRRRRAGPGRHPAMPSGSRTVTPVRPDGLAGQAAGRYFFLSYARLSPLPAVPRADIADPPDRAVRSFYRDLQAAVARRAAPGTRLGPGFLDVEVAAGSHWRSGLVDALGAAEVFVPLLSPQYYRRSWPLREWAAFERRAGDAETGEPGRRFVPVLWVPVPAQTSEDSDAPGLAAALSLADAGSRARYAELGLLGLQRRKEDDDHYRRILGTLAARIVALAEKTPIGPSPAAIPALAAPPGATATGRVFTVTVTARGAGAGATPADYLLLSAEKLGFAARVRDYAGPDGEISVRPGFLLIEPGRGAVPEDLDVTVAALPPWVLPVVLTTSGERTIFAKSIYNQYGRRPEIVRRALSGIGSLRELLGIAPLLVAHAEREYLGHSPSPPTGSRSVFPPRPAVGNPHAGQHGKENSHD